MKTSGASAIPKFRLLFFGEKLENNIAMWQCDNVTMWQCDNVTMLQCDNVTCIFIEGRVFFVQSWIFSSFPLLRALAAIQCSYVNECRAHAMYQHGVCYNEHKCAVSVFSSFDACSLCIKTVLCAVSVLGFFDACSLWVCIAHQYKVRLVQFWVFSSRLLVNAYCAQPCVPVPQ